MATNLGKPVRLRNDSGAQLELDRNGTATVLTGSGGNLGIGTTSPATPLHVVGIARTGGVQVNTSALIGGMFSVADWVGSGSSLDLAVTAYAGGGNITFYTGGTAVERMRIDSVGRALIGTTTARQDFFGATADNFFPQFQIEGTGTDAVQSFRASLSITKNGADNRSSRLIFAKTRAAANGGSGIVSSGDSLGQISFQGNDGAKNLLAAFINSAVEGTPALGSVVANLTFTAGAAERLRITSGGNIGVNTTDQFGGGVRVVGIANATTVPASNPTGGGVLYVEAGALKYRGSSGTVTTIANA